MVSGLYFSMLCTCSVGLKSGDHGQWITLKSVKHFWNRFRVIHARSGCCITLHQQIINDSQILGHVVCNEICALYTCYERLPFRFVLREQIPGNNRATISLHKTRNDGLDRCVFLHNRQKRLTEINNRKRDFSE